MSKNNGLFEQLTEENLKGIYEYYYQHSAFHNTEQAVKDLEEVKKDLEEVKNILVELCETNKTKPE